MNLQEVSKKANEVIDEVEQAIIGKKATVTKSVISLLCNGHILIEDIPGVGKTTLAKSLAKVIGGEFRRMQFTPDLLPSDITGGAIFNQKTGEFEFRPGPIFGNIVLADEINRATPKTQSGLLEAMEERTITTDGETRSLPNPFFVIATQNSVEMTGTNPLPEAQLDRFFMRVSLGYPDRASEISLVARQQVSKPVEALQNKISLEDLLTMQKMVKEISIDPRVREYIVDIVQATRSSSMLRMGASPRGSLHLALASQAHAVVRDGRHFVLPDDVKAVAASVLGHRVLAMPGVAGEDAIARILETVPVPVSVA